MIPIPDQDDLNAARIEAARRTEVHVEQPQTSQRREGLDMKLEYFLELVVLHRLPVRNDRVFSFF